jgi:hypothetical protein
MSEEDEDIFIFEDTHGEWQENIQNKGTREPSVKRILLSLIFHNLFG